MAQVQAYQGYFQSDGQFVFSDALVKPPKNKKVTILWEDDSTEDIPKNINQKLTSKQQAVVIQVIENLEKINREPLDEETRASFDAFDRGEFRTKFSNRLDCRFDEDFK